MSDENNLENDGIQFSDEEFVDNTLDEDSMLTI